MPSYHRLTLIKRAYARCGVTGAAQTAWRLLRDRLLGQHRLLFAMSGEKAAQIVTDNNPLEIHRFDNWEAVDAAARRFLEVNRDKIHWDVRQHLSEGMVFWIGHHEGRPKTIAQTRSGQDVRLYFFPMTERCALISHCYTAPEARGQGLYVAILKHIARQLAADGFTRIYIDCSDSNTSSERGILSTGFLPIGRGQHRRDGSTRWRQDMPPSVTSIEAPSHANGS